MLHHLLPRQCLYTPLLSLEHPPQSISDTPSSSEPMEILSRRMLNINPHLTPTQIQNLIGMLKEHQATFAWEYQDMQGIHPNTCTHHIYIEEGSHPIQQPQC